jgi:hypothetical protein
MRWPTSSVPSYSGSGSTPVTSSASRSRARSMESRRARPFHSGWKTILSTRMRRWPTPILRCMGPSPRAT